MSRRDTREQAFLFLFGSIFTTYSLGEIIEYWKDQNGEDVNVDKFTVEIFTGVMENITQIDEIISEASVKWSRERISKVALTILRIAVYEMLFIDNIPVNVSANEAVELAKKFGTQKEAEFVNGVLGAVIKTLEKKDE